MGGCIAYEMAQRLRAAGEAVSQLGLIDSRAHNASARPLCRNSAYGQMARKDWLSDDAVMLGILFPSLAMDWEALRGAPCRRALGARGGHGTGRPSRRDGRRRRAHGRRAPERRLHGALAARPARHIGRNDDVPRPAGSAERK